MIYKYSIQMMSLVAQNYTAVCVVDLDAFPNEFVDCNCYNATGTGFVYSQDFPGGKHMR